MPPSFSPVSESILVQANDGGSSLVIVQSAEPNSGTVTRAPILVVVVVPSASVTVHDHSEAAYLLGPADSDRE